MNMVNDAAVIVSLLTFRATAVAADITVSVAVHVMPIACRMSVMGTVLWSPYVIGRPYVFSSCFFVLSSFFFFFFPRLISAVGDWMFTMLWHMVWP